MELRVEHNRTLLLENCLSMLCQVKYPSALSANMCSEDVWESLRTQVFHPDIDPPHVVRAAWKGGNKFSAVGLGLKSNSSSLHLVTHAAFATPKNCRAESRSSAGTPPLSAWTLYNAGCHVKWNYMQLCCASSYPQSVTFMAEVWA